MNIELIIEKILQSNPCHGKEIQEHDGVYFPKHATGNHLNWSADSKQDKNYMKDLLEILDQFHKYAEANNFLYSLNGGTLMGYYWNGNIMPWDDDIDLWMQEKDYFKVRDDLWNQGVNYEKDLEESDTSWYIKKSRIIKLGNKKYEIIPNKLGHNPEHAHLTKILPLNLPKNRQNIGGLDIGMCRTCDNKKLKEGWKRDRPCFIPENPSEQDFPVVNFSGIKTRAVVRKLGEPVLDEVYGPKWRIPCHPSMKNKFDITPYLK